MIFSIASFVAGVIAVQQMKSLPDAYDIIILIVIACVLAFFRKKRMMFFVIGIVWVVGYAQLHFNSILSSELEGRLLVVQGVIESNPKRDNNKVGFNFKVIDSDKKLPTRIRLNWYRTDQPVKPNQFWRFTVKLKKPYGRYNPGGFDYERWLFVNQVGATGYVRNRPQAQLLADQYSPFSISAWRYQIIERLKYFLEEYRYKGLLLAVTTGDRSLLTPGDWDVLTKTGVSHLIAISGLHIGLAAGLVYGLVIRLWALIYIKKYSPQIIAACSAFVAALLYAALAGFSLPTQRALIMLSVVLAAIIWQRHLPLARAVSVALLLIVLWDPLAVLSVSFWLSFTAVFLIMYAYSGQLKKAASGFLNGKIHCLLAVGLAPLTAFYFAKVSIIAPIANWVAVPVFSLLVTPMALSAVIAFLVAPDFSIPLWRLCDFSLNLLWTGLDYAKSLPYSAIDFFPPDNITLLFALFGVLILFMPRGVPGRYLSMFLFLPLLTFEKQTIQSGELKLTMLDVGQGLAVVIETQNHVLLFDAGARYSDQFDLGKAAVLPYLVNQGIGKVDMLIVSHGDNDHIGGAQSIIQAISVQQIMVSQAIDSFHQIGQLCITGQSWVWDEVTFEILSPPSTNKFSSENNNSCVLKITAQDHRFLLTGDIEKEAEKWLAGAYGSNLKSDVMIAPHHGSKTSSSVIFLQQVDPDKILIPAGYRNRFGFPHQEVIDRYRRHRIEWLNSYQHGAITVFSGNGRLIFNSARKQHQRYWLSQI